MGNAAPTRSCLLALVALSGGALLAQVAEPAEPVEPVRCEGEHFVIEFLPDTMPVPLATRLAAEALATVESAWPVFAKQLQWKTAPRVTLRIHVAAEPFHAVGQRLLANPLTITGMAAADGSEGHVLLFPRYADATLDQVGLPRETRHCVVSIAGKMLVQQFLGAKADDWAAEVVAVGLLEAWANPQRAAAVDTGFDGRRGRVVQRYQRGEGTELATIVRELRPVVTDAAWIERFADRALLAEQMARMDSLWVGKFLRAWQRRKGDVVHVDDRLAAVESVLGGDWKRSEARFTQTVKAMRPQWQIGCSAIWRDGAAWLLLGTTAWHACAYAVAMPPEGAYALRGTFEAPAFPAKGAFRVHLDGTPDDMLGVWFEAPNVRLAKWHPKSDTWDDLVVAPAQFEPGQPTDFRCEITRQTLRVLVNGREAFVWPVGTRTMHGWWGVAVGETLVRLNGIGVDPLREPKK